MLIEINAPTYYAEVMVTKDWYEGYRANVKEIKVCICNVWVDVKKALPQFVIDMVAYKAKGMYRDKVKKQGTKEAEPVIDEPVVELTHEKSN